MLEVMIGMATLIALGAFWRWWQPGGRDADQTRGVLSGVVYYYLLPALVVQVLWQGDMGLDSVRIAVVAGASVLLGTLLGWLAGRLLHASPAIIGAMILAAAYPNATYMGLPVLDTVLGSEARGIAIQFDYFACVPLLLTLGVMQAQFYGTRTSSDSVIGRLLRVPPVIAALVGVSLNISGLAMPGWLDGMLGMMAAGVVPLMLLSLGMSLSLTTVNRASAALIGPVLVIQLLILPLFAWGIADTIGLTGLERTGTILEAAMPSMVLGIVFCDRYGLDSRFYSLTVTVSTVLALVTLPVWLALLQG